MHEPGPRFNAIDDGWMEGIDDAGRVRRIGIAEALCDGAGLISLGGSPTLVVSALRLLVAVATDALAARKDEWPGYWQAGRLPSAPIDRYLDEHYERFELFHPRTPFLQDAALRFDATPLKSVAEIVPFVPTGASAVLYDRRTGLDGANPLRLGAAEACGWLVAAQQFCVSGMCGRKDPATESGPVPGRAGLLVDRLLAVPTGRSLARTILLSMAGALARSNGHDRPPWRRAEAVLPGPAAGPVGYLTWMMRHILLDPEPDGTVVRLKIAVDPAIDPRLDRAQMADYDPHLIMRTDPGRRDGWRLVNYVPHQAAWQQTPALIAAAARPGGALAAARAIAEDEVGLEVFGFAVESHSKPVDHLRSRLPVPLMACSNAVAKAVEVTRAVEAELVVCAHEFAAGIGMLQSGSSPLVKAALTARVARDYYTGLGASAAKLLADLAEASEATPLLIDGWQKRCAAAARLALTGFTCGIAPGPAALSRRFKALRHLERALARTAADTQLEAP